MVLGYCQNHETSGNILVPLLVQEQLFKWQYIASFRAYLDMYYLNDLSLSVFLRKEILRQLRENVKHKIWSTALLNSSINFVIYYFMSRQFRKTFIEVFGSTCCTKCPRARFLSSTRASGFTKHKVTKCFLGLEINCSNMWNWFYNYFWSFTMADFFMRPYRKNNSELCIFIV